MRNMNIDIDVPLLLDMPFQSSKCLEEIEHIKDLAALDLTMMQYYFFTCSHELAASKAAGYLEAENVKIRIGALLIFTFSHMAMGHKKEARNGRGGVEKLIAGQDDFSKESCVPLMFSAAKTVLHIPITETERRKIDVQSHHCNEGGRLMCCYILEQDAWNAGGMGTCHRIDGNCIAYDAKYISSDHVIFLFVSVRICASFKRCKTGRNIF